MIDNAASSHEGGYLNDPHRSVSLGRESLRSEGQDDGLAMCHHH